MKKLTLILLITLSIVVNAQKEINWKLSKADKQVITGIGAGVTMYGVLKKGFSKEDIYICSTGILFAAMPYVFEKIKKSERFEISASGINIKLKYDKKYKKCKKYKECFYI